MKKFIITLILVILSNLVIVQSYETPKWLINGFILRK